MSDETVETTQNEAPAPEATQADERMERATARIERQLGTEAPAAAPEPEADPAAEPQRSAPSQRPTDHPATIAWRQRQQQAIERARREGGQQTLERLEQQMAEIASRQGPAPAAAVVPEDPEPQAENYRDDWSYQQAWIAWNGRQQEQRILSEMQKQVGPVLDQVRRAHETQEQYQERVQQEAAVRQEMTNRRALFVASEQDYAATPEGSGYYERFMGFYGHPGLPEQGIPPYDGILTRALVRGGLPVEDARRASFMSVQALGEVGMRYGIPPALLVDGYMREILESSAGFAPTQNGGGNGNGAQAPAVHPRAAAGQREIAQLKAAAKTAAPVAGSVKDSASGRAPGPVNWKVIAKQGRGAVEEILKERYGSDWKKGLSDMRRAAHELRTLGT